MTDKAENVRFPNNSDPPLSYIISITVNEHIIVKTQNDAPLMTFFQNQRLYGLRSAILRPDFCDAEDIIRSVHIQVRYAMAYDNSPFVSGLIPAQFFILQIEYFCEITVRAEKVSLSACLNFMVCTSDLSCIVRRGKKHPGAQARR